jgi:small subunit ribosomal protein S2
VGAEEPLAEWERELLGGDAEKAAVEATGGDAAKDETPAAEGTGAAAEAPEAATVAEAATEAPAEAKTEETVEEKTEEKTVTEGEYGADSAAPLEDGSAPEGFEVKGNKNSMKFHAPTSPWYSRTAAEVWFRSVEAAEKAGFVNAEAKAEEKA